MQNELKDQISKIKISEVFEKAGITVQNIGTSKMALCPFHDDTRPSLTLYDNRDGKSYYHCFACNAHGDAIHFLKNKYGYDFKEAIQWLSRYFDISFAKVDKQKHPLVQNEKYQFSYEFMKKLSKDNLLKEWAESKRKVSMNILKKAGVLYIPKGSVLSEKGYDQFGTEEWNLLEDAGIVRLDRRVEHNENKGGYINLPSIPREVFWYSHVLFPVHSQRGDIVGYAAREDSDVDNFDEKTKSRIQKYKYTKGFEKSKNLYRVDNVFKKATEISKNSKSNKIAEPFHVYIVEGILDALRLESLGLNALAILGSSLCGKFEENNSQLGLIKTLGEILKGIPFVIHLFLDNDAAGRKGTHDAINKLLTLRNNADFLFLIDVVMFPDENGKDPDEILKNSVDTELVKKNIVTVYEFESAFILDCKISEIYLTIERLTNLQKAQLRSKIFEFIPEEDELLQSTGYDIERNIPDFLKNILEAKVSAKQTVEIISDSDRDKIFKDEISRTILQCEFGLRSPDFPIDYSGWKRLGKAGMLLINEFKEILQNSKPTAPFLGVLVPREGGKEPRLLAMPCSEDLIVQEYVLNCLNRYIFKKIDENRKKEKKGSVHIPVICYDAEKDGGKSFFYDGNDELQPVSFAYQINKDAFRGKEPATFFRHFAKCWEDYNKYIENRVRRSPVEVLYPARLDIHRYYDSIAKHTIIDMLKPVFEKAYNDGLSIPFLDPENNKKQQRAAVLVDFICNMSFGYEYYAPNGEKHPCPYNDRGIPQGPNLSAWLANMLLFNVDKAMSKKVEEINLEYIKNVGENNKMAAVATYARYVDDIILLAPDANTLQDLKDLFAFEIGKIGLSLSSKTDPMEPEKVEEIMGWLQENRGIGKEPSGDFSVLSMPADINNLMRKFLFETMDRKYALTILHNDEMAYGLETEEIRKVVKTVVEKSEELKYRDKRHIAVRLLKVAYEEVCKDVQKDMATEFIRELDIFKRITKPDSTPDNEEKIESLTDYIKPLDKIWPLLVSLEGIQLFLNSRHDRAVSINSENRESINKFRKWLSEKILNGLIDDITEKFSEITDCSRELSYFNFLIYLRKFVIFQQAKSILESRKTIPTKQDNKYAPFAFSVASHEVFSNYLEHDKSGGLVNRICAFHATIQLLEMSNADPDCQDMFDGSINNYLNDKTDMVFAYLRCFSKGTEIKINIDPEKKLDALQTFANIVTSLKCQYSLLCERRLLLECLCDLRKDDGKYFYILSHPQEITRKFIKCLLIDKNNRVEQLFVISMNVDQGNSLSSIRPVPSNEDWEEIKITENTLKSYKHTRSFEWTVKEFENAKTNTEKLQKLADVYPKIIDNIKDLDDYLITPFNILESNGEFNVFSAKYEKEDICSFGLGKISNGGLHTITVPKNNSKYWRTGIAVAGLLNKSIELLVPEKYKLIKPPIESKADENLAESVLRNSLYLLSGSKWWSGNNVKGVPFIVERNLKRVENFVKSSSTEDKIDVFLNSNAETFLTNIVGQKRESVDRSGSYALIADKLHRYILPNNSWLLGKIKRNDVDDEYENFPRAIAALMLISKILFDRWERSNRKYPETNFLIQAYRISAVTNMLKIAAIICMGKADIIIKEKTVLGEKDVLEKLELTNNYILALWHDANGKGSFIDGLNRYFKEVPFNDKAISQVTPLGWLVALKYYSGNKEIEIDEKILTVLISDYICQDNWPWPDKILEISEDTVVKFFNDIQKDLNLKTKIVNSSSINMNGSGNLITFTSSDGDFELEHSRFIYEGVTDERSGQYENHYINKRKTYRWTETWINDELFFVSIVGQELGKFFLQDTEKHLRIKTNSQVVLETSERNIGNQEKVAETNEKEIEGLDENKKEDDLLREFQNLQKKLWKLRQNKDSRYVRTAFFQFDVDETYTHPLKEACEIFQHSIGKDGKFLQIKEIKSFPENYHQKYINGIGAPLQLVSCAEFRRQKLLEKIIETCKDFDVDLLLLPEYSVRPETIKFIKKKIIGSNLTVWCGTYRLPYWSQSSDDVLPMQSILHVVNSKNDRKRGKKYPAVGLGELFNPKLDAIEPICQWNDKKNLEAGDFVYEMICSENFCLTSPANKNGIVLSWDQLRRVFSFLPIGNDLNDILNKDLDIFSNWVSIANAIDGDWKKYSPRRSLLFVPAMTTRSIDYHMLGLANYLSAAICTVFCNTTKNSFGNGGSCFIGFGCLLEDKNSNHWMETRLGPYNGCFPGLFHQERNKSGSLGENDQAIVIADIDPTYQSEGKPKPQLMMPPLKLVAHIPVIEYSEKAADVKNKCSCGKKREDATNVSNIIFAVIEFFEKLNISENSLSHLQKVEVIQLFKELLKIESLDKDKFFKKKMESYKNESMIKPSPLPPAALYDILFVKTMPEKHTILPEIEVPPFRQSFDSCEPPLFDTNEEE